MTNNKIIAKINELMGKNNPCNIRVSNGVATCRAGEPCCGGCKHLSKTGCTVSAHACRMWYCEVAWAAMPLAVMVELYKLIGKYKGAPLFRHDQEPSPTSSQLWKGERAIKENLFAQLNLKSSHPWKPIR